MAFMSKLKCKDFAIQTLFSTQIIFRGVYLYNKKSLSILFLFHSPQRCQPMIWLPWQQKQMILMFLSGKNMGEDQIQDITLSPSRLI